MAIEVRPAAGDDESEALARISAAAFGMRWRPPSEERRRLTAAIRDPERVLVALDAGRLVAGCVAHGFRLTVPGGTAVPVAGLSGVAVDPTRTGRGLLRELMAAHLADARRRGEVASVLLASESGIYRRFGYGWATSMAVYEATSASAGLRDPLDDEGELALVTDTGTARHLAVEVYREAGRRVAGTVSRPDGWWDIVFGSEAAFVGGGPQWTVVHRDRQGRPDGYLLYTVESGGPDDGHWTPGGVVHARELVGLDATAELALWRYCTRVPLTRRVRWLLAPPDPAVRWHLADPRQLRTVAAHDLLWLRILDVAAVLQARCYHADGRVSFHLDAPDDPQVAGPWTLEVTDGVAAVTRGGDPAARLDVATLGSAVLGEVRVGALAAAGLVSGDGDGIGTLDRLLATPTRPFCLTKF